METVGLEVYECEFLIANTATLWVNAVIETAANGEARLSLSGSDQANDHLMGDERLAAPVLRYKRKETVLDLVPLAGPRR